MNKKKIYRKDVIYCIETKPTHIEFRMIFKDEENKNFEKILCQTISLQ